MFGIDTLIPARFLTLTAHLCVVVTLLWESQQSVQHCLPVQYHQDHLIAFQKRLVVGYGASIAMILLELITFITGLTMFSSNVAFASTFLHGFGTIALAYFILDSWLCDWFWFIFTFCSVLPGIIDIVSALFVLITNRV